MNAYFLGGITIAILSSVVGLIWYANRAGRNAARVQSEKRDVGAATEAATASRRALDARTNGIRNNDQLEATLEKGNF